MANDRLSLMCAGCGSRVTLFKYYPTIETGYCPLTESEDEDKAQITQFFRKHIESCHPLAYHMTLGTTPGFVIVTEEMEGGEVVAAKRAVFGAVSKVFDKRDEAGAE